MNDKALIIIEASLTRIWKPKLNIEKIKLFVSFHSELAKQQSIETRYGMLQIFASYYVPKGYAYIYGKGAFDWVIKKP